jgi:hypothetical protein
MLFGMGILPISAIMIQIFSLELLVYQIFPIDNQENVLLQQQSTEQGVTYGKNISIPLATLKSEILNCPKK